MLDLTASLRRVSRAAVLASAALLCFGAVSAAAQERFTISADGQEVTDATTHLIWRRCAEGTKWIGNACVGKPSMLSLGDAKSWAAAEASSTGKSWRVPDESELATLVDKNRKKPKIDTKIFVNSPSLPFWCLRPGFTDNLNGYMINFANGKVDGGLGQRKIPVRLVRSN